MKELKMEYFFKASEQKNCAGAVEQLWNTRRQYKMSRKVNQIDGEKFGRVIFHIFAFYYVFITFCVT